MPAGLGRLLGPVLQRPLHEDRAFVDVVPLQCERLALLTSDAALFEPTRLMRECGYSLAYNAGVLLGVLTLSASFCEEARCLVGHEQRRLSAALLMLGGYR